MSAGAVNLHVIGERVAVAEAKIERLEAEQETQRERLHDFKNSVPSLGAHTALETRVDEVASVAAGAAANVAHLPDLQRRMEQLSVEMARAVGAIKLAAWAIPVTVAACGLVATVLAKVLGH